MSATPNRLKEITTQTTTVVAPGPAILVAVNVNTGATSAVCAIYDHPSAATGTPVTIDASSKSCNVYAAYFEKGITVVTSGGNADISVTYR